MAVRVAEDQTIETSPHAWSKLGQDAQHGVLVGNISTCVEQTSLLPCQTSFIWKHLHMRGANPLGKALWETTGETSPHAWSKLKPIVVSNLLERNISTCVEQTRPWPLQVPPRRKHLHMRGANRPLGPATGYRVETSPHAWSKRLAQRRAIGCGRNISTCVEQTPSSQW